MPEIIFPVPIEDLDTRDPEWQQLEEGYGQNMTRIVYWDSIHPREIKVEGPVIDYKRPERPA